MDSYKPEDPIISDAAPHDRTVTLASGAKLKLTGTEPVVIDAKDFPIRIEVEDNANSGIIQILADGMSADQ